MTKRVLITGGSRRLGLHLTEQFLAQGWQVLVLTRQPSEALDKLACDKLDVEIVNYSSESSLQKAITPWLAEPLDLLVHNASLFDKDIHHTEELGAFYDRLYQVHMRLPMLLNEWFSAALMASDNGNIIHMTDIYADTPNPAFALYCSTKAALENLSKSYAMKLAPKVRVNSIQPGPLKFLPDHSEAEKQAVMAGTLIPIEAGFEPVFTTINYLLSNAFVTGTHHRVDGGRAIKMNR
jgi:dihydromonapterin reductase / dihydrofolate reductase